MIKESAPEFSVSGSDVEEEKEEPKIDGEKDPDFSQVLQTSVCVFGCLSMYMYLSPHGILVLYALLTSVWGRSQTTEAERNRFCIRDHYGCRFQVGYQEKHEAQEIARGEGPHRFCQPDSKRAKDPGLSVTELSIFVLHDAAWISCDIAYCIHRSCMRSLSLRLTKTSP